MSSIWAVVPIKETGDAKQRLARFVPAHLRPGLALAMAEDVLAALAAAQGLAGIMVVTADPGARAASRAAATPRSSRRPRASLPPKAATACCRCPATFRW
jgi:2-phospho-L-lactate guanylyltransferase